MFRQASVGTHEIRSARRQFKFQLATSTPQIGGETVREPGDGVSGSSTDIVVCKKRFGLTLINI